MRRYFVMLTLSASTLVYASEEDMPGDDVYEICEENEICSSVFDSFVIDVARNDGEDEDEDEYEDEDEDEGGYSRNGDRYADGGFSYSDDGAFSDDDDTDISRRDYTDEDAAEAGDPVVLATGELVHDEVDFLVEAPGAARLTFRRTYRSKSDSRTSLGSNWFHNHDVRLILPDASTTSGLPSICRATAESCALLRRGGDEEIFFRPPGASFYVPLAGVGSQLSVLKDALGNLTGARLQKSDGTRESFDSLGYLVHVSDRFGNFRKYEYTSNFLYDKWETHCSRFNINQVEFELINTDDGQDFILHSGFCRIAGAALGIIPYKYAKIPVNPDATPAIETGLDVLSSEARLMYLGLRERSWMYPSYEDDICDGYDCLTTRFIEKTSSRRQIAKLGADGGEPHRVSRITNSLGYEIRFNYYHDNSWMNAKEGLLAGVALHSPAAAWTATSCSPIWRAHCSGPATVAVGFSYDSPDSHVGETDRFGDLQLTRTGEQFLVAAARSGAAVGAVEARRTTLYRFPWTSNTSQNLVAFYSWMINRLMFREIKEQPLVAMMEIEQARSRVVDNIVSIFVDEHDGYGQRLIVSSKYDEVYDFRIQRQGGWRAVGTGSFDRVVEQKYGGPNRLSTADEYQGAPARFFYSPQGDQLQFSEAASSFVNAGSFLVDPHDDYTGPAYGLPEAGVPPATVPESLRSPYLTAAREGDIQAVEAPCSEIARGVAGLSVEAIPIIYQDNDYSTLRSAVDYAAAQVCNWTLFIDRDGQSTWTGMNFMGMPLVTARSIDTRWLVTERRYNGQGLLVEERWPALEGDVPESRVQREYIEPRQWTSKEMKLDGQLRSERLLPQKSTEFIEEGQNFEIELIEDRFTYEDLFAQMHRATRTAVSGQYSSLVREVKNEFVCPVVATVSRCAPGTAACDRMADFREMLENIRYRISLMHENITCGDTCASAFESDFKVLTDSYVSALRELELDYLGKNFAPLEDALSGFSGFESAMAVDVAANALLSSTSPLVADLTFRKEFDDLALKLGSSTCSKAGSCTSERSSLRSLVSKRAGTSELDRMALGKFLPNGSQKEFWDRSVGFLSVESADDRKYFFIRIDGVRSYATKAKSGYTKKSRTAFLDTALANVAHAISALDQVNSALLREFASRFGDVSNCGRTNPDVVHVGLPGEYRTVSMSWAPNGLPLKQTMEGGGSVDYQYYNAGRGLLTSLSETGMSSLDVADVLGTTPCGNPSLPSSWLRSSRCWTRDALGITTEMQAIVNEGDRLRSVEEFGRNALGSITSHRKNGAETLFTVDTWGRTLQERSPAGRVTRYGYGDSEVVAVRRGESGRQAAVFYVHDAEGRVLQECTELVSGACSPYRSLISSVDFSSPSCADILSVYQQLNVLSEATFQLKMVKRSIEGRPLCVADEIGHIVQIRYNSLGRVTSTSEWNSHDRTYLEANRTAYRHDLDGNLVESVVWPSDGSGGQYTLRETYARDGFGRVTAHRLPLGQIATTRYDAAGHVVDEQVHAPDGGSGVPDDNPLSSLLYRRVSEFDVHNNLIFVDINGEYTEENEFSRWGTAVRRKRSGFEPEYVLMDGSGNVLWAMDGSGESFKSFDPVSRKSIAVNVAQSSAGSESSSRIDVFTADADGYPKTAGSLAVAVDGVQRARSTTSIYDQLGHLVAQKTADGRVTEYENNLAGWPLTIESERIPGGPTDLVDYDYAANGAPTSVIDPSGEPTVYELDGDGRVAHVDYPNGERRTTEFDGLGQPVVTVTTSGTLIENNYSLSGRLSGRSVNGLAYEGFGYDALSRLSHAERTSTVDERKYVAVEEYRYDALGRLAYESTSVDKYGATVEVFAETALQGAASSRVVDIAVKGLYPRTNTYTQSFDGAGRMHQVSGSGWSRKLDFKGGVTASRHAEGARTFEFTSPRDGFMDTLSMTAQHATNRDARRLLRDAIGQIVVDERGVTGEAARVRAYTYGENLRLENVYEQPGTMSTTAKFASLSPWEAANKLQEFVAGAQKTGWVRDELGSPLQRIVGGGVAETWERTAGGSLVTHNQQTITHDADKRVRHDGQLDFKFDPLDMLLEVSADDEMKEGYVTGPSGRLLAVVRDGNTAEVFAWDGWNMIGSFTAVGSPNWRSVWGEMNELLRFENRNGEVMVPVLDSRHSIVGGWTKSGNWLGSVDYEESGARTISARCSTTGGCELLDGLPFGYAGGWTGSHGLVYFRHRWYSPKLGQFLSVDPLEYRDSYNRFAYAAHDPINFIDPWGLGLESPDKSYEVSNDDIPGGAAWLGQTYMGRDGVQRTMIQAEEAYNRAQQQATIRMLQGHATGGQTAGKLAAQMAGAPPTVQAQLSDLGGVVGAILPGGSGWSRLANISKRQILSARRWAFADRGGIGTLRARVSQLAGFAGSGPKIIIDQNLAIKGLKEAMINEGFDVVTVQDAFGPGSIPDSVILGVAKTIGAKVLTRDRGHDAGGGFGDSAIRVDGRVSTVAGVLRTLGAPQ